MPVANHSAQAGFYTFTIFTAGISSLLSFAVCLLNYFYSKNKRCRFHTLVTLLLLCDGFGSLCFVVWTGIDDVVNHNHNYICHIFLPFPTYFFLLGFCWTSLIARRFKRICEVNNSKHIMDIPLWLAPLLCLLLITPIFLLNILGSPVSETISAVSAEGLDFCFFGSSNTAFLANLLIFQLPCVLTLFYNLRCFRLGIRALRSSPVNVMEREVRRAKKYLFVLLVIWVPNLIVNLYHSVFLPPDKDPFIPVQALVLLTSLQGFLNFFVYLWGYKPFQQWLSSSLFFHIIFPPDDWSERGSAVVNGLLLTDPDNGDKEDDEGEYDQQKSEKEPLTKSILSTSPMRDSGSALNGGSGRSRIASGEKAVRFEDRHECRYYDIEDHVATATSQVDAFMPRNGYYADLEDASHAEEGTLTHSPTGDSRMSLLSNI